MRVPRTITGWKKDALSAVLYLLFTPVFVSPMFFLLIQERHAMKESTWYFVFSLLGFFLTVAPSIYYMRKIKGNELKAAGYF